MRRLIVTANACEIPSVGARARIVFECSPLSMGNERHRFDHGIDPVDGVIVYINGTIEKSDLSIRGDLESMEKLGLEIRRACRSLRVEESRREAV
jgi:hypothetical protein